MTTKHHLSGRLEIAISRIGGKPSVLAKEIGVSPQSVTNWRRRGRIPAEQVIPVERATGVPRHVLRPDLYPE